MNGDRVWAWFDSVQAGRPDGSGWLLLALSIVPISLIELVLCGEGMPWWLEGRRWRHRRDIRTCCTCSHGPECALGRERIFGACEVVDEWREDEYHPRSHWSLKRV